MSHYFIPDDNLQANIKKITYLYKNINFTFTTNSGLFSKDHVDEATSLLINNIPPLTGSLLDMGCGYGCIGIILGKTYSLDVTQCDVNPHAINLTKLNCRENDFESDAIISDCFENITDKFDTITLNPPIHAGKAVTYKMYEQSIDHLNDNGYLYVVTLKKHGAESTIKKLTEIFGNCDIVYKKKGYYVLKCKK